MSVFCSVALPIGSCGLYHTVTTCPTDIVSSGMFKVVDMVFVRVAVSPDNMNPTSTVHFNVVVVVNGGAPFVPVGGCGEGGGSGGLSHLGSAITLPDTEAESVLGRKMRYQPHKKEARRRYSQRSVRWSTARDRR